MRIIFIRTLSILVCCSLLSPALYPAEIHPRAGTTSASFLKLGVGSRAVAMGGSFAGLADDVTALYWNPAGLVQLQQEEVSLSHNESFESIRHDFAGYAVPFRGGVLAGALYGLYTPSDLERRTGLNESDPFEPISPIEGYFQAYDIAAHVGYGRRVKNSLAVGAGLKYIRQTIDDTAAQGIAADIGLLYRRNGSPLSFGLAAQHIGPPITFREKGYDLPLTLKAGAAWRKSRSLVLTGDVTGSIDNYPFISLGTEYLPFDMLALRFGYRYRLYGLDLGDLSGLSAGLGLNFALSGQQLLFDYAFVPYGVLGNSHRVTLSMRFNGRGPAVTTAKTRTAASAAAPSSAQSNPVPATAPIPDEYRYTAFTLSGAKRAASGRTILYAVKGTADGTVVSFQGTMNTPVHAFELTAGEKNGAGDIYREIVFRANRDYRITRCSGTLRLPREIDRPALRDGRGTLHALSPVSDDGTSRYYSFSLDTLAPFSIIKGAGR